MGVISSTLSSLHNDPVILPTKQMKSLEWKESDLEGNCPAKSGTARTCPPGGGSVKFVLLPAVFST